MKTKHTILIFLCWLLVCWLLTFQAEAQVAKNYSVGTWFQFKPAAVSYTFDDNCSNQLAVALPMLDNYGFKATFFTVTTASWNPNWTKLKQASTNGHEVASHTVDHTDLSSANTSTESQQSQNTINSNITTAKCVTIAYPDCVEGDVATLQKYYIAGRVCSGQIMPATPSDFFTLSSNITGNQGSIQKAADFNAKATSAMSSGGWVVYLTHGISVNGTSDGGYSPTVSTELSSHLTYMNTNIANYWVGTFGNVVKYIKERNGSSVTETTITNDSLKVVVANSLDNTIYNVPVSIRRTLPAGWTSARVYIGGKLAASTLPKVNGTTYIQFDVVPNSGNVFIASTNVVTAVDESEDNLFSTTVDPNPFWQETAIRTKGDFSYSIASMEGRLVESGNGTDALSIGNSLQMGVYILSVRNNSKVWTKKIVKQ